VLYNPQLQARGIGYSIAIQMALDDFVMTLGSDEESPSDAIKRSKNSSSKDADEAQLDPAFTFDIVGDPYNDLLHEGTNFADVVKSGSKPVCPPRVSCRPDTYCKIRIQYPSMISLQGEGLRSASTTMKAITLTRVVKGLKASTLSRKKIPPTRHLFFANVTKKGRTKALTIH
jgi:hypothetical protein